MAESFSREKLRHAPQKRRWVRNPVSPSSCVTPAGTSNEPDVQNEWEENTKHTHNKYDSNAIQPYNSGLRAYSLEDIGFNDTIIVYRIITTGLDWTGLDPI